MTACPRNESAMRSVVNEGPRSPVRDTITPAPTAVDPISVLVYYGVMPLHDMPGEDWYQNPNGWM
jgi:hypothetical protein